MQVFNGKIEGGKESISSAALFLSNSINGVSNMTIENLPKICTVENCERPRRMLLYCDMHHHRNKKHGDPLKVGQFVGEGDTYEQRFWSKIFLTANIEKCWEWQGSCTNDGYGRTKYNSQAILAHHKAWFLTYGFKPKYLRHTCDNPPCCNPHHLLEGDAHSNTEDKVARNRQAKGESSGRAVLTESQVVLIKQMLRNNLLPSKIGRQMNISRKLISCIKRGVSWKHID
jgi:hypothetical protein